MKPKQRIEESDEDDGGLASECPTEFEDDGEDGNALDEADCVGEEEPDEIEEVEDEEEAWVDDPVQEEEETLDIDDVVVPTRWRRQKKEKKARTYEGSPLRSEPDDDIF